MLVHIQEPRASHRVRNLTAAQILVSSVLASLVPSPRILSDPVGQHLPPCPGESECLPAQLSLHCPPESAGEPRSCTALLCLRQTDSRPPGFDHVPWTVGRLVKMFWVPPANVSCAYIHLPYDSVRSPIPLCHQKHLSKCLESAEWRSSAGLALGWVGAGRGRSSGKTLRDLSSVTKVL